MSEIAFEKTLRDTLVNYLNKVYKAEPEYINRFLVPYKIENLSDDNPIIVNENNESSLLGLLNGYIVRIGGEVIHAEYSDDGKFITFD